MASLIMEQVYREVDGHPRQVLVDLGYAKHQVACGRAQRLVEAGLSKRNISVDINGRLVARLPTRKCELILAQFPAISEPGAYWMTTHTWRDEQGDPNPPPPPPPAPQTEWPIPEISAQALVEVFGEHDLYPTDEAGYFATRRQGRLGCTASGALAIIAGMTSLKGTQGQLLDQANRITCERYPAWWRYGLSDGWHGLPINRQEPEQRAPPLGAVCRGLCGRPRGRTTPGASRARRAACYHQPRGIPGALPAGLVGPHRTLND